MGDFWFGFFFTSGAAFALAVIAFATLAVVVIGAAVYGAVQGARDAARRKKLRAAGTQIDTSTLASARVEARVIFPPPGARRK